MALHVTTIMLAVDDLARSKAFYADGMGCKVEQDYPGFVLLNLGDGSSSLALYPRDAAAQDAGVSPEGSGFEGVSFHYIVDSGDLVDEVMSQAVAAGAGVVRQATSSSWGRSAYFSDPDGHLWKVASS
jgi:uncharacterized protein